MYTIINHPLVRVHVTALRDHRTDVEPFRRHLTALSRLLAFPALEGLEVVQTTVATPLAPAPGFKLARAPVLVPVLRAGLGMVEGFRDVLPESIVSHLGMYRDHETLKPVRYYSNFPANSHDRPFIILDPMLATGGSAVDAIDFLKSQGARHLRLVSIIAAPEGLERLAAHHPEVAIVTAAVDDRLDERGYILPGLGDAGDRQFGTL